MSLTPTEMKRLAELRQKTAGSFTVTPVTTLGEFMTAYLHAIATTLSTIAQQRTGMTPNIQRGTDGSVILSMTDPETRDSDTITLTIDFNARVLKAHLSADASQGGQEGEKIWKLAVVSQYGAGRMATFIYHNLF